MTYREGDDWRAAKKRARHLARVFNSPKGGLESALHMGLVEALEETALIQNQHPNVGKRGYARASFKPEPHDGFYTYRGSIDTTMVAEYLNLVAVEWTKEQERAA